MEWIMNAVFFICGFVAIVFVLFISIYLIISGLPAIREIGLVDFLFGREWASTASDPKFGILPFILTSIYGTCGAIILGVPVGFMTAVFLAKVAPPKLAAVVRPAVDLLAERGLLRRAPDTADRRVVHLALTEQGMALSRAGQRIQSRCLEALLSGLTHAEAEQFQSLLEKVLTHAEAQLREGGRA